MVGPFAAEAGKGRGKAAASGRPVRRARAAGGRQRRRAAARQRAGAAQRSTGRVVHAWGVGGEGVRAGGQLWEHESSRGRRGGARHLARAARRAGCRRAFAATARRRQQAASARAGAGRRRGRGQGRGAGHTRHHTARASARSAARARRCRCAARRVGGVHGQPWGVQRLRRRARAEQRQARGAPPWAGWGRGEGVAGSRARSVRERARALRQLRAAAPPRAPHRRAPLPLVGTRGQRGHPGRAGPSMRRAGRGPAAGIRARL